MNKRKLRWCQIIVLLNKPLVKTVDIFFELHVVGSFDPSKGAILKNYSVFYSKIEDNVLHSSNNHPY